jgi:hypothetical protein
MFKKPFLLAPPAWAAAPGLEILGVSRKVFTAGRAAALGRGRLGVGSEELDMALTIGFFLQTQILFDHHKFAQKMREIIRQEITEESNRTKQIKTEFFREISSSLCKVKDFFGELWWK